MQADHQSFQGHISTSGLLLWVREGAASTAIPAYTPQFFLSKEMTAVLHTSLACRQITPLMSALAAQSFFSIPILELSSSYDAFSIYTESFFLALLFFVRDLSPTNSCLSLGESTVKYGILIRGKETLMG